MNPKEFLQEEKNEKAYELIKDLRDLNFSFDPITEALHTLLISYALDKEADPEVITSYSNLRRFLQESEELLQEEKNTICD